MYTLLKRFEVAAQGPCPISHSHGWCNESAIVAAVEAAAASPGKVERLGVALSPGDWRDPAAQWRWYDTIGVAFAPAKDGRLVFRSGVGPGSFEIGRTPVEACAYLGLRLGQQGAQALRFVTDASRGDFKGRVGVFRDATGVEVVDELEGYPA